MAGHSKWAQIKRQKEKTDKQKSKTFTKYARLITAEARVSGADSPAVATIVENAKKENVPKDVIERAIKKATESGAEVVEEIIYESYGPGGAALIIKAATSNRNKASQEIKHILSKNGFTLATPGSALWAFYKENHEWLPTSTIPLEVKDIVLLEKVIEELLTSDEVEEVFTNAE